MRHRPPMHDGRDDANKFPRKKDSLQFKDTQSEQANMHLASIKG